MICINQTTLLAYPRTFETGNFIQDNVRNYYSQNAAGAWNGARNFYKKWATASIFALGGVAQTQGLSNVIIDFGRNENQIDHAARHVLDRGYNLDAVQSAIREQLRSMSESLSNGPYTGNVSVGGVKFEYRSYKFEDGSINVGRITPPRTP